MKKIKAKTKPVPLNKMTRKQLLSQLRKVKRLHKHIVDSLSSEFLSTEQERDEFRQSLNGALEEIANLKAKWALL